MTLADRPSTVVITEQLAHIAETVATIAERQPLATQETVDAITARLATMAERQQPGTDVAILLADCRDTITEGIGALHSQGADVLHALQMLQAPPATPQRPRQRLWVAGVAGMVLGGLLMGATWWVWPDGGHRAFAVALDAMLVQHHGQLPPQAQDALTALYRRYQLQTPGSRQKGRS